jgi:hypothetical protein
MYDIPSEQLADFKVTVDYAREKFSKSNVAKLSVA